MKLKLSLCLALLTSFALFTLGRPVRSTPLLNQSQPDPIVGSALNTPFGSAGEPTVPATIAGADSIRHLGYLSHNLGVIENMTDGSINPLDTTLQDSMESTLSRIASTAVSDAQWYLERVDAPKFIEDMTDRSLRIDNLGRPHIVYGADHLYYAWHDGITWNWATADNASGVGRHASLALDVQGRPHTTYLDYINEDLKYAYWTGTQWSVQIVDSGIVYGYTSIEIDAQGKPHISYYGDGYLKYANFDGAGWQLTSLDFVGGAGFRTSIAINKLNQPHIGYTHWDMGLKYAWHDEAGWHKELVDSNGSRPSLTLDEEGHSHIAYFYNASDNGLPSDSLMYGRKDMLGWQLEVVSQNWPAGGSMSIATGELGQPHIAYAHMYFAPAQLLYANKAGSQWMIHTVSEDNQSGTFTGVSVAIDSQNNPHIGFFADSTGSLRYINWNGATWQINEIDKARSVGRHNSLALDKEGHVHISYSEESGGWNLKYARQDEQGWHLETVDSDGIVGEFTSLALDQDGNPHIAYFRNSLCDLKYAWKDANGWYIETVDSVGYSGVFASLELDADGYPHISYHESINGDLKYAWKDELGWHIETVDSDGIVGEYTSLALDSRGHPHISYRDYPNGSLKYARKGETGWSIHVVDENHSIESSLAMDRNGYPHISYYGDCSLKYASWNGSSWIIETIKQYAGRGNSLAFDWANRPYISYIDSHSRLAYWDSGVWEIETVDPETVGGPFIGTSLAFDSEWNIHISYTDYPNGDLKYAYGKMPPNKPWLIMYYLAGDNNLNDSMEWLLDVLKRGQGNSSYNIAVMFDGSESNDSLYYYIADNINFLVKEEVNSGDPNTLVDFVKWARSRFPIDNTALIIHGHGRLVGIASDNSSQQDSIELSELGNAFQEIVSAHGKIDIVFMEACLMGTIEGAFEIKDYADFYIASENTLFGPTPPLYLDRITSDIEPEQLAIEIAQNYHTNHKDRPHTISVGRLSAMSNLSKEVSGAAVILREKMTSVAEGLIQLLVLKDVQRFDSNSNCYFSLVDESIDLYDFARLIGEKTNDLSLRDAAQRIMVAIQDHSDPSQRYIVYSASKSGIVPSGSECEGVEWNLGNAHGVSIFFPKPDSKRSFYNGSNLAFAEGTDWGLLRQSNILKPNLSSEIIQWGPMLVDYVQVVSPGAFDDPSLPPLSEPISVLSDFRLPNYIRLPLIFNNRGG